MAPWYLLGIKEERKERDITVPLSMDKSLNVVTCYSFPLDLEAGDVLYLEGSAEISWPSQESQPHTEDNAQLCGLGILATPDIPDTSLVHLISHQSTSNLSPDRMNLQLQASARYPQHGTVTEKGTRNFSLGAYCGTNNAADVGLVSMPIATGCGHLLAKVFRPIDVSTKQMPGLLAVFEETREVITTLAPGGETVTVYRLALDLKEGDRVYVAGQVEFTNDLRSPVGVTIKITADRGSNTERESSFSSQVVFGLSSGHWAQFNNHHMTLRIGWLYTASNSGSTIFEMKANTDSEWFAESPAGLKIEPDCGHMLAMVYR